MPEPAPKRATIGCPFCDVLNRVDLARLAQQPKCGGCGRPLLLDRPHRVAGPALDRILADTDIPVLVDFYADWCGPCKVMAPLLDDVARTRRGELLVAKLDTDRYPELAARYEIRGIPTLIAFVRGREAGRQVGAVPASVLGSWLDSLASQTLP